MTDATFVVFDGRNETATCLPNLRYVPSGRFGIGPEAQKLQQAWRISVVDSHGKVIDGRYEWRDVPYEPNPSAP